MFSWCAGVNQHPSTFWSITLQPLRGDQATIPHMKGDILSFHKSHTSLTCYRRLRGKITWNPLPFFPLVEYAHRCLVTVGLMIILFAV